MLLGRRGPRRRGGCRGGAAGAAGAPGAPGAAEARRVPRVPRRRGGGALSAAGSAAADGESSDGASAGRRRVACGTGILGYCAGACSRGTENSRVRRRQRAWTSVIPSRMSSSTTRRVSGRRLGASRQPVLAWYSRTITGRAPSAWNRRATEAGIVSGILSREAGRGRARHTQLWGRQMSLRQGKAGQGRAGQRARAGAARRGWGAVGWGGRGAGGRGVARARQAGAGRDAGVAREGAAWRGRGRRAQGGTRARTSRGRERGDASPGCALFG